MYICGDTGKSFSLDQASKTGFHSQPCHIMSLTEPLLRYGVKRVCCGGSRFFWCEIQLQLVKKFTYSTECQNSKENPIKIHEVLQYVPIWSFLSCCLISDNGQKTDNSIGRYKIKDRDKTHIINVYLC